MLAYVLGENKAIWKSFQHLHWLKVFFFRIFENSFTLKIADASNFFFAKRIFSIFFKIQ